MGNHPPNHAHPDEGVAMRLQKRGGGCSGVLKVLSSVNLAEQLVLPHLHPEMPTAATLGMPFINTFIPNHLTSVGWKFSPTFALHVAARSRLNITTWPHWCRS